MSDYDARPDPVDQAYVQAEALLDEDAVRAARRARVLGAVARQVQEAPPATSAPSGRRLSWGRHGWLAAASVAGISALVALRIYSPVAPPRPPGPATPSVVVAPTPEAAAAPVARGPAAPLKPAPRTPAAPPRAEAPPPRDEAVAKPAPLAGLDAAPAPAPPPAPPPASARASDMAVTASRIPAPPPAARAAAAASESAVSPVLKAARLRAAAAAGRIAELTSLLAEGTPVDAPDADGETALMQAIQSNRPAAAAVLRRHGADLDLENRAGESARDMATSIDDPELNRALRLDQ